MQTRRHSVIETLVGTFSGFVLSVTIWEMVVKPVWHIQTSFVENLSITALFTVVSIIRGYVVRRLFNLLTHNKNKKEQHDTTHRNHGPSPQRQG